MKNKSNQFIVIYFESTIRVSMYCHYAARAICVEYSLFVAACCVKLKISQVEVKKVRQMKTMLPSLILASQIK